MARVGQVAHQHQVRSKVDDALKLVQSLHHDLAVVSPRFTRGPKRLGAYGEHAVRLDQTGEDLVGDRARADDSNVPVNRHPGTALPFDFRTHRVPLGRRPRRSLRRMPMFQRRQSQG